VIGANMSLLLFKKHDLDVSVTTLLRDQNKAKQMALQIKVVPSIVCGHRLIL